METPDPQWCFRNETRTNQKKKGARSKEDERGDEAEGRRRTKKRKGRGALTQGGVPPMENIIGGFGHDASRKVVEGTREARGPQWNMQRNNPRGRITGHAEGPSSKSEKVRRLYFPSLPLTLSYRFKRRPVELCNRSKACSVPRQFVPGVFGVIAPQIRRLYFPLAVGPTTSTRPRPGAVEVEGRRRT